MSSARLGAPARHHPDGYRPAQYLGIEGVRTVKTHFPAIQILMFTVFDDDEKIFDAIRRAPPATC